MKSAKMRIDLDKSQPSQVGRIDFERVDMTCESDILTQQLQDEAEAMLDAAKFARRVRKKLGFSQVEFAKRINVSLETIRNWEQGKRCPTGAAKALLKVLDQAPEVALTALH
jgi:putative transcriptional regulator